MPMIRFLQYLFLPLFAITNLAVVSCGDDEGRETEPLTEQKLVIALFSPGGLGDRGYNDQILTGLQRVHINREDCAMLFSSPQSMDDAEKIFADWLDTPSSGMPCLFILASVEYEAMANRLLTERQGEFGENKSILLFETQQSSSFPAVYTFKIEMYGASYLAGITAAVMGKVTPMSLLGSASDREIRTASDGFADGYRALTGNDADLDWLSEDWHGYTMSQEAYERMADLAARYDFIFPVAGGSNLGIYRYLRDHTDGPHVAGMDIDQSPFSNQIVGSVVKHIDRLVEDGVTAWLNAPTHEDAHWDFGLKSGYIDWQLSSRYADLLPVVEQHRKEAEEMEEAYKRRK